MPTIESAKTKATTASPIRISFVASTWIDGVRCAEALMRPSITCPASAVIQRRMPSAMIPFTRVRADTLSWPRLNAAPSSSATALSSRPRMLRAATIQADTAIIVDQRGLATKTVTMLMTIQAVSKLEATTIAAWRIPSSDMPSTMIHWIPTHSIGSASRPNVCHSRPRMAYRACRWPSLPIDSRKPIERGQARPAARPIRPSSISVSVDAR